MICHGWQSAKIFGTPFDYETAHDLIDALVTMAGGAVEVLRFNKDTFFSGLAAGGNCRYWMKYT